MGILLFLIVCLPVTAVGGAVFGLYLWTMSRTLRLVRPEHRGEDPGRVWFCVIPLVGNVYFVWLVGAVARSLRRQYTALGEHRLGADYGLEDGRVCSISALLAVSGAGLLAAIGGRLPVYVFGPLVVTFICVVVSLGVVSLPCFLTHWRDMNGCRIHLQNRFTAAVTQDELDYADDLPKLTEGE